MPWTEQDIPDQTGRTALIVGATDGLGLRCAEVLAGRGARVLMTYRDVRVAGPALASVTACATDRAPELVELDLMSLESVAQAAASVRERTDDYLDILLNNAGIMSPPLTYSWDGLESQWATNVVGHAALTWRLLPAVLNAGRRDEALRRSSRVVLVSSIAHWGGRLDRARIRADLAGEQYRRFRYYFRTKLADLVFARELNRRLQASGSASFTQSLAAHPGLGATNIATSTTEDAPPAVRAIVNGLYRAVAQPVERATLPLLLAATHPGVRGGELVGPNLLLQTRGHPVLNRSTRHSRDRRVGTLLWDELAMATGLEPASDLGVSPIRVL